MHPFLFTLFYYGIFIYLLLHNLLLLITGPNSVPSPNLRQIGTWLKQKKEKKMKNFWNVILNWNEYPPKRTLGHLPVWQQVTCFTQAGPACKSKSPLLSTQLPIKTSLWMMLSKLYLFPTVASLLANHKKGKNKVAILRTQRGCPKPSWKGTLTYQNCPHLHARHCRTQHCPTDPLNPVKEDSNAWALFWVQVFNWCLGSLSNVINDIKENTWSDWVETGEPFTKHLWSEYLWSIIEE